MNNEKIHELAIMISSMAYEMSMHNHTFIHFEQRVEQYLKRELADTKDPETKDGKRCSKKLR